MAAMAAPGVARGPRSCRDRILLLDQAATEKGRRDVRDEGPPTTPPLSARLGRRTPQRRRMDPRGFGPRPHACKARMLPLHHGPVTSGAGVEPARADAHGDAASR